MPTPSTSWIHVYLLGLNDNLSLFLLFESWLFDSQQLWRIVLNMYCSSDAHKHKYFALEIIPLCLNVLLFKRLFVCIKW